MKHDIDEMLHLTADIAEELLAIKDNDGDVSHALRMRIDRLAELAAAGADETDALNERIEKATQKIIMNRAEEIMEGADAPLETEHDETEALIEKARKEAMDSEDEDDSEECHVAEQEDEAIAKAAEFEENADADEDTKEDVSTATASGGYSGLTGKQLRGVFSLNDIFLYQRTLFGGSAEKFNASLEEISHLSGLEEIKSFLSEKCSINLKTREAKDFLASVGQFFPY